MLKMFVKIIFMVFKMFLGKKNDLKTRSLGGLKVLSYASVIIPVGVAATYGISSLNGRFNNNVSKNQKDKISNISDKTILKTSKEKFDISPFLEKAKSYTEDLGDTDTKL